MSKEITKTQAQTDMTALHSDFQMAQELAAQNWIPKAYQGKPADTLIAIERGRQMHLAPYDSLTHIVVIYGVPTLKGEFIERLVRGAGHKLRISFDDSDKNNISATCTIIRKDDPNFKFTVKRDMNWARRQGLAKKDNYIKQPDTMLGWRAITACARWACSELLGGMGYTPDEIADNQPAQAQQPTVKVNAQKPHLLAQVAAAQQQQEATARKEEAATASKPEPKPKAQPKTDPQPKTDSQPAPITKEQNDLFNRILTSVGVADASSAKQFLAPYLKGISHPVNHITDLTQDEANQVLNAISQDNTDEDVR